MQPNTLGMRIQNVNFCRLYSYTFCYQIIFLLKSILPLFYGHRLYFTILYISLNTNFLRNDLLRKMEKSSFIQVRLCGWDSPAQVIWVWFRSQSTRRPSCLPPIAPPGRNETSIPRQVILKQINMESIVKKILV